MSDSFLSRILRRIGRTAHPLFEPDADARRARDAATKRAVDRLASRVERLSAKVESVTARVDRVDTSHIKHLEKAVDALHRSNERQSAFAKRLLRSSYPGRQREFTRQRVLDRLRDLSYSGRPIIVGPWTGEVGFELLYWAPFVRWVVRQFHIDQRRLVIVSRGGTQAWYGLPEARYVDVLERRSAAELRDRMAVGKKQRRVGLFDRRLMRQIRDEQREPVDFLHPSWMYALCMPYWKQSASIRWVDEFMDVAKIEPPVIPGLTLPSDYVAVRFYFSDCFPDTVDNRALVKATVTSIARERNVVLVGSGVSVDEHADVPVELSERIHTVNHLIRPENNLAVQTAVIARAAAFIGTYGGFSYLAPLCGVDTVAFYSENNYYEHHLDFAQQMFEKVGGGTLTVVDGAMRALVGQIARPDIRP